jgi:antagonist of KipI
MQFNFIQSPKMSLTISKAGLLDTVQDGGRYGFQQQGINPGGAMDRFSASLANALLGKELTAPVIEMHFPAPQIQFHQPTIICLTGADFSPLINGKEVPMHQPVAVGAGAVLSFGKRQHGARSYLALVSRIKIESWLNSYSTNLKATAGGYAGRRFQKGDEMSYEATPFSIKDKVAPLPWQYRPSNERTTAIEALPGPEWNWITPKSQTAFLNNNFLITPSSDRMGYRLQGEALVQEKREQLVSSAVSFGTVQLLPNGQLIC